MQQPRLRGRREPTTPEDRRTICRRLRAPRGSQTPPFHNAGPARSRHRVAIRGRLSDGWCPPITRRPTDAAVNAGVPSETESRPEDRLSRVIWWSPTLRFELRTCCLRNPRVNCAAFCGTVAHGYRSDRSDTLWKLAVPLPVARSHTVADVAASGIVKAKAPWSGRGEPWHW